MSAAARKKPSYRKFIVKDPNLPAGAKASAPTPDASTRVAVLEGKFRKGPIKLVRGKSKVVTKVVAAKKPSARAGGKDVRAPTPTKKAFYLGGKPVAYQG